MTDQPALFADMNPKPQSPLKDPVDKMLTIIRDTVREKAVLVKTPLGEEAWVARELIRFDGPGLQRVKIESWKAKELKL